MVEVENRSLYIYCPKYSEQFKFEKNIPKKKCEKLQQEI